MLGLLGPSVISSFDPRSAGVMTADGFTVTSTAEGIGFESRVRGEEHGVAMELLVKAAARPCPDAEGTFSVDATIEVRATKGGLGQTATLDLRLTGTVGDDAELATSSYETRAQWSSAAGGAGQFVDVTITKTGGLTVNRAGGTVTDTFARQAILTSAMVGGLVSEFVLQGVETAWKSGKCVALELVASDGPSDLETSQVVSVLAAPRSAVDGRPTGGTVTGRLSSGATALEPSGAPLPAPARFTYTAADEQKATGTASFESRSRRGIGKAEMTFTTADRRPTG